jgi:hypothetical protein
VAGDDRFEDTMDALEAQREVTEGRFRELLDELAHQVATVRAASERSTALYQQQVEARRAALASVRDSLTEAAGEESLQKLEWQSGKSGLRRRINRLARWVIRDFLEVLDRRGHVHTRNVEDLKRRVDRLQDTISGDGAAGEALDQSLNGMHQALQAALATHAEMLDLVNAKDAEVLQRAVAGPLRRMEVLFDEFARQQEALLAQLVGRHRELDEVARALTERPSKQT